MKLFKTSWHDPMTLQDLGTGLKLGIFYELLGGVQFFLFFFYFLFKKIIKSYCHLKSSSFCVSSLTKSSSFWVSRFLNPNLFACLRFLALQRQDPGSGYTQSELKLGSGDTQKEPYLGSGDTQTGLDFKWKKTLTGILTICSNPVILCDSWHFVWFLWAHPQHKCPHNVLWVLSMWATTVRGPK